MSTVHYNICIDTDWSVAANNALPDLVHTFTSASNQTHHINPRFGILGAAHPPPFTHFDLPHGLIWSDFPHPHAPLAIISAMALSFPDPHFATTAADDADLATPFSTPAVASVGILVVFQASPMRRSCYDFVDCNGGAEGVSLGDVVGAVEECVRRAWGERVWGVWVVVW